MKASTTSTFDGVLNTDASAKRYRNQATGVSPCRGLSEAQGARRSRLVIDAAPVDQLRVKDRSYPQPGPAFDPLTGKPTDRVTGKAYVAEVADTPSTWTR